MCILKFCFYHYMQKSFNINMTKCIEVNDP